MKSRYQCEEAGQEPLFDLLSMIPMSMSCTASDSSFPSTPDVSCFNPNVAYTIFNAPNAIAEMLQMPPSQRTGFCKA